MRSFFAVVLLGLLGGGVAHAGTLPDVYYLVDTGPGGQEGGLSMTPNQYLAAEFRVYRADPIVSVEGWMLYPNIIQSLPVHVRIYGEIQGLPDFGNLLFQQLMFVPFGLSPDWHGVDGMALELAPGFYWLSFEVDEAAIGSGAMPPTPLMKLDNYATWHPGPDGGTWTKLDTANLGIRIAASPEPDATLLASVGLLVVALLVRSNGALESSFNGASRQRGARRVVPRRGAGACAGASPP